MPRKITRTRKYDVWGPLGQGVVPSLPAAARDQIARILGALPSDEFIRAYRDSLGVYTGLAASVTASTPAAVQKRLGAVSSNALALQGALRNLNDTDRMLIARFETMRISLGRRYIGVKRLQENLAEFVPLIKESLEVVSAEPKQGRMPAFAGRSLASSLAEILNDETGRMPTAKRGGALDRLLRLAFSHAGGLKARRDVVDLLKIGVRELHSQIASPSTPRLSSYRVTAKDKAAPIYKAAGKKSPKN